jgi:hypothetical protein
MRVLDMELIKLFGFTPATAALLGMESTAGGSFRLVYAISHPVELGMAEILGNIHRVGDGDEKGTGRLHVDTYWMANQPQWINGDRLALEPPQEPGWPSEPVSRVMLVFGIVVFLLGMSLLAVLAVRYWQKNKQNPSAYRPIDGQIIF